MALPTLVSAAGTAEGTNVGSHTIAYSGLGTLTAGNWLVLIFGMDGASTITPPSGWTEVFLRDNVAATVQAGIYIKEVTGSESGNITVGTGSNEMMSGWVGQFSGVDDTGGNIIEALSFHYGEMGKAAYTQCPLAYAATPDCYVIHAAVSDGGSGATWTNPGSESTVTNGSQISASTAGVSLRVTSNSASNAYVPGAYFVNASTAEEVFGFTILIRSSATETYPAQPVIRSSQVMIPSSSSGASSFDWPYNRQADDVLITLRTSNSTTAEENMASDGFTNITTTDVGTLAATLVDYIVTDATETGVIEAFINAGSAQTATLLHLTHCDTTTPINATHSSSGTSATPNDTGVTPSVDNCLILWLCGADDDDNTYDTNYPSGWTGIASYANQEGLDTTIITAYKTQTTAAATGTVTGALNASEQWVVTMIAVAPAAGSTSYTLTASGGTYTATGTAASLENASKASAAAGSYAVTGTAASLEYARPISAEAGAYSITGTAASLEFGAEIAGGAGAYTVTGTAASLEYHSEVNAEAGSYSVTGTDAAFQYGKLISAAAGSYTITGTASSLEYHAEVAAGAGAYSVTGTAASLERGAEVNADAGSYTVTGTAASLESGAKIGAVSGSYSYTGTAASLESAAEVAAEAGSYSVSGTDATLLSAGISVISADGGVYTVNGIDVSLLRGAILSADTGQYVYTGYEADLTFTESDETPALRHYPHKWPLKVIYGKESYLVYSEQEQEELLKRLWKVEEVKRPKKRKKLRAYVEETNEPVSISYTFTAPDYSVLSDIRAEQARLDARRAQDLDDEEALTLILMAI